MGHAARQAPDGLHLLGLAELLLEHPALLAIHNFFERPADSDDEPRDAILDDVIRGPALEAFDRAFFADRARDKDERNLRADFAGNLERRKAIQLRHGIVGDDKIRF